MAGMGYDPWGNPYISGGGRRRRVQQQEQIYADDDGGFYVPEPRRMRPANINIINENNVIDDHPDYYERPQPPRRHSRVYAQEQQIVTVARARSPSESSYQIRRELDELRRRREEQEKEDYRKQVEAEVAAKAAKKREDDLKRAEEEKALKKKAVEEWKAEEEKKAREKKEKEEEKKKIGEEYLRQTLRREGWTEEEIDDAIKHKDKKHETHSHAGTIVLAETKTKVTYGRVDKKHIAPEILEKYGVKWAWGADGLILIYQTLTEGDKELLLEETRKYRETKLIKFAEVEEVVVKGINRDRQGRLVVTRKKEHGRSKSPAVKKTFFLGS